MSESKFGGPPRSKRGGSRWPEPDDEILKALDEVWASNRNGATVYFPVFETKGNPHDIIKGRIEGFIRDGIREFRVTARGVRAPKAFRISPVFEDGEDQYLKILE